MWFKGSCFFRNFPHWGVCSAVLGPCQAAQSGNSFAGSAMWQQWHCRTEARPPLSLGTRQPCTSSLVGTGTAHTTFLCCFLILACQEWGKMGCSTWEGKGEVLDVEKASFLLPAFSFLWAVAEWLSQGAAGVMTIVSSQCSTNLGYSSRVVWSQSTCHRIRMLFWPGSNLAWVASTLFSEARDQKGSWDGQRSPCAWSVEITHLGPQHAVFYLSVSLRDF